MSSSSRTRVLVDANELGAANVKAVDLFDVDVSLDGTGIVISTETGDVVVTGTPGALVRFARNVLNASVDVTDLAEDK